jgi:PhzF family phenazine biosynthesis protein
MLTGGHAQGRRWSLGTRLFQVDAFTNKPFSGNPAAVCILGEFPQDSWMQNVAFEMNLSETAFVCPGDNGFDLRWFTPLVEVDLCGHATLATSHILWETGTAPADEKLSFQTRSGILHATRLGDWIELDFPASSVSPAKSSVDLTEALALGSEPVFVGRSEFDFFVEIDSEQELRGLRPKMEMIERAGARGVIVTSRTGGDEYHFISRFFAPQSGVPEDPVTGSAHCSLGPYWGEKLDLQEMIAFQASPRGGEVRVRLGGDRVYISGQAVTVLQAELI